LAVKAWRDGSGVLQRERILEHWAGQADDEVLQLRGLAARVETLLVTQPGDAAVVRRMDWTGTVKREVVAKRGQAEGVVAATLRARIPNCRLASGKEIASLCGGTKADIEAAAVLALGADYKEAGSAALAALAICSG
jgi:hypothetical protein